MKESVKKSAVTNQSFRTTDDIIGKHFEDFAVMLEGEAITIENQYATGEKISFDSAEPKEIASELRKIAAWLDRVPVLKADPSKAAV